MLRVPLLIIGTAHDGPTSITLAQSPEQVANLYGAYRYETFTLTSSTSSITLAETPWTSSVDVYYKLSNQYYYYFLYNKSVSGNLVTFSKAGEDKEVTVKYYRNLDSNNIVRGYMESLTGNPEQVYLLRIPGSYSITQIGSGSNYIKLTSKYHGDLYNSSTFTFTTSTLTITPPAGRGISRTYSLDTPDMMTHNINLDTARGYGVYHAEAYGSETVPASSNLLTSGLSGTLTTSGLSSLLESQDLYGVDIVSVVGFNASSLSPILTEGYLENAPYPTAFVQGVYSIPSGTTNSAYVSTLIASAYNNRFLFVVASDGYFTHIPGVGYWASLAPAVAAALSKSTIQSSRLPINLIRFTPDYSETLLNTLASCGFIAITNTIAKGPAIYKATTSYTNWSGMTFKIYQSICRILYDALEPMVGGNIPSEAEVNSIVNEALAKVGYLRFLDYSIYIYDTTIQLDISVQPYGDVAAIKFQIGVVI